MNEIMSLYQQLHNNMTAYLEKYYLATLFPMSGKYYREHQEHNEVCFMLVGRALNGWDRNFDMRERIAYSTPEEYSCAAISALEENNRFEWLKNSPAKTNSAFWRTGKNIYTMLSGVKEEIPDWYEHIVWANLYPVAWGECDNPPPIMKMAQKEPARKLLEYQIKYFKPTHILFETDWTSWFYEDGETFVPIQIKSDYASNDIVRAVGTIGNAKVVIAARPDSRKKGKSEQSYAESVIEAFNIL